MHYARNFGRSNVYQLAFKDDRERQGEKADVHEEVKGRTLFGPEWTYSRLQQLLASGAQIRRTKLTREFGLREWEQQDGGNRLPLFLVEESGALSVFSADRPMTPRPGQAIISLSPPTPAEPPEPAPAAQDGGAAEPEPAGTA
jgi:hypothetical protein